MRHVLVLALIWCITHPKIRQRRPLASIRRRGADPRACSLALPCINLATLHLDTIDRIDRDQKAGRPMAPRPPSAQQPGEACHGSTFMAHADFEGLSGNGCAAFTDALHRRRVPLANPSSLGPDRRGVLVALLRKTARPYAPRGGGATSRAA